MNYVLGSVFWIFWIMWFFPRKYKYRCIRVYVWSKDDIHVIWMWIWLMLKNISLLDIIWILWFVRFAHSPPNFIFWLGRLIFSVSINSHPDSIYIYAMSMDIRTNINKPRFYTYCKLDCHYFTIYPLAIFYANAKNKFYKHIFYLLTAFCLYACEFESSSGKVYSIQHYVIKFVSDVRQVGGFVLVIRFHPPIKLTVTI